MASTAVPAVAPHPPVTACIVGLATFVVFLPAVACDFVNYDDHDYVRSNPLVLAAPAPGALGRAWTEVVLCNWAPLTIASYQLDAALWGMRPAGFHLTNVLLHALSAGLLHHALVRLTGAPLRSLAAALLFGLHPLRVEPVAWVSSRKDVLSVFFLVLTLLAWERYCRRPAFGRLFAATAAFVCCMLAKSTLVTLPALLLLLDVWPLRRGPLAAPTPAGGVPPGRPLSWRDILLEKAPLAAVALLFAAITLATHVEDVPAAASAPTLAVRCCKAAVALRHYLVTSAWPFGLHLCYEPVGTVGIPAGAAAAVAVSLGVFLWLAFTWRRFPPGFVGVAWFVLALLPVLGVATQVGQCPYADRHAYAAHVGLAVATAWVGAQLAAAVRISAWAPWICGLVVAGCVAADLRDLAHWRSDASLWRHVLAVDPDNIVGRFQQALALEQTGDLEAAEAGYRGTLAVGDSAPALAGLARVYVAHGRLAEAGALGEWARRLDPADRAVRELLAMPALRRTEPPAHASDATARAAPPPAVAAAMRAGLGHAHRAEYREALALFRQAIAADPGHAAAHNNAGLAAMHLGDRAAAEQSFLEAVRLAPAAADYATNLARLYALMGRDADALPPIETAARLAPHDPEISLLRDRLRTRVRGGSGPPRP